MALGDIVAVRRIASAGEIYFTHHALEQMLERGISTGDVETILSSCNNEIVEKQSPSRTAGKEHNDIRMLIYDPGSDISVIVVVAVSSKVAPTLTVITAEHVDSQKWCVMPHGKPSLVRK